MTIPYRVWTQFDVLTCHAHDPDSHNYNQLSDWQNTHLAYGILGEHCIGGNNYEYWVPVFRPKAGTGFEELAGMDRVADVMRRFVLTKIEMDTSAGGATTMTFYVNNSENINAWDAELATGRYYDGINQWDSYGANLLSPPQPDTLKADIWQNYTIAGWNIVELTGWTATYFGGTYLGNTKKDDFYRNGWASYLFTAGFDHILTGGDIVKMGFIPQEVRVRFFNPVVNSMSVNRVSAAGGDTLVLTGIGFDQTDAELSANGGGGIPFGGFNSVVEKIRFTGLQGQGSTEILGAGWAEFVVDSDTQITIADMPALANGTYTIELYKNLNGLAAFYTYAGDWRAYADGFAYLGDRLILRVGPTITSGGGEGGKKSILLTKWRFKDKLGNYIFKNYAPIDVRTTEVFYDGRILSCGSLKRAIDQETGMYTISDIDITLANNDKEFCKLLATYFLKNQYVEIFHLWTTNAEQFKTKQILMVVDDYWMEGTKLHCRLKDVTQKYFRIKLPFYRITEAEFPNVSDYAKGKPKPEVVGLASRTDEPAGAVEAFLVDTTTHKYLAARGSLHAIPQVYSDGTLKATPGDYSVAYGVGGATFITFTASQGDNKVTFNCEGYIFGVWNSANGYVQNPAYVMGFLLAFLAEIPSTDIDLELLDDLADVYTSLGFDESGFVIVQEENDTEAYMQELLFTYGSKLYPGKDGKFKLERKDLSDLDVQAFLFAQIHALQEPKRNFGLRKAVNYAKARFNLQPTNNIFAGETEYIQEQSVDDFEANIEPDATWDFPWTGDADFVLMRLTEDVTRLAFGEQTIEFSTGIDPIDYLNLFDTFRFQDPYAVHPTGAGEEGRYYYVESMEIDFMNSTISWLGVDLQYLAGQYFIFGDESIISEDWITATEFDRYYGYQADENTGVLPDGTAGKILIDEALVTDD